MNTTTKIIRPFQTEKERRQLEKLAVQWKLLDIDAHLIPLSSFTIKSASCIIYSIASVETNLNEICTQSSESIKRIDNEFVFKVLKDVSQALNYLHESGYTYLNLNLRTVGVRNSSFYLTDCSQMKKVGKVAIFDPMAPFETYVFWHPSLIGRLDIKYYADSKIDLWALGILGYFLFTKKHFVAPGRKLDLVRFYKQHHYSINEYLQIKLADRPEILQTLQKLFQRASIASNQKEN